MKDLVIDERPVTTATPAARYVSLISIPENLAHQVVGEPPIRPAKLRSYSIPSFIPLFVFGGAGLGGHLEVAEHRLGVRRANDVIAEGSDAANNAGTAV